jgi:pimeloyl-ACP methyl ester carboxylesterase
MLDSVRQRVPLGDGVARIVVGLSMGGMVAAEWVRRYPAELAGCVLVNASLRALSPLAHRLQWRGIIQLMHLASRWRNAPLCERAIWALTSNRPCDPKAVQTWIRIREHAGMSSANALRQLVAAARYRGSRIAPPVPALILTSHADRLVSWRCSQRIAETWDVPLRTHPWAGHDLPLDDGAWVADALLAWWQSSTE